MDYEPTDAAVPVQPAPEIESVDPVQEPAPAEPAPAEPAPAEPAPAEPAPAEPEPAAEADADAEPARADVDTQAGDDVPDGHDDGAAEPTGSFGDHAGPAPAVPLETPTKKWRRRLARALVVVLFWCGAGVGAVEAYIDSVPLPGDPPAPQASVLYYRDGHTILARVGTSDHSDVPLSAVPKPVRDAVLAAEDRDFYSHSGVSLRGVARALVADAKGAGQGASTITQQYARNAYLTQEVSAGRKAKEFALAVKLERRYTKDQILERYLNSIYFGRGAYGIAAAAHAYFGISPQQLTLAQGAVLASVVKDPWHYDPAVNPTDATYRYGWVIASMRTLGWTSDNPAYPSILPRSAGSDGLAGPDGLIVDQVERELGAHGIAPQDLHTKGLSVVTTLDPVAQRSALTLVASTLHAEPAGLHAALVAVDPATGGVRAYYGGEHGQGYFDDADAPRSPASTFKPIALAAGMEQGIGYLSRWDGTSPRVFPDRLGVPLRNHDDLQCPNCTLQDAMVASLNTPFYAVTQQIGADKVRAEAQRLGIATSYAGQPSLVDVKGDPRPGKTRADIAIGRYPVTPADLATVYATFADGGVRTDRHFVESVAGRYTASVVRRQVLDPRIAADVSTVLQAVVAGHDVAPGRTAAGKTGTQEWGNTHDNQDAWMAGYTPQLATVVWMGLAVPGPIRDANGTAIEGETVPSHVWKDFTEQTLTGQAQLAFPTAAHVGRTDVGDAGRSHNPDAVAGKSSQGGSSQVTHTAHTGKYLALTFDDGPSDYTHQVLDLLDQYHVKATFCMVGEQVDAYHSQVRRMVSDGMRLCNHSAHHDDLGTAAPPAVLADLGSTNASIAAAVPGATVTYFRAPYGDWGGTPAVAASLGLTPLGWMVDPDDWQLPGVDKIVSSIRAQLKPGYVVLVHDGGGNRQQTVDALKILIPQLLADGWQFDFPQVTVTPHALPTPTPSTSASTGTPESTTVPPSAPASSPPSAPPSAGPSASTVPVR